MNYVLPMLLEAALSTAALLGQKPVPDEPTIKEIVEAYQSKTGEHDLGSWPLIKHWESYRIRQIRGWSISFKRTRVVKIPGRWVAGITRLHYRVRAIHDSLCSQYELVESRSFAWIGPPNVPNVTAEPSSPCH